MKRFLLCFFVFGIVLDVYPEDIKLKCWILSGNRDEAACTAQSVSNHIDGVNQIYSQICMKFTIHSISSTNDAYLANVNLTNTVQWMTLTSIEQNTGMLELYFVSELEGGATVKAELGSVMTNGAKKQIRPGMKNDEKKALEVPSVNVSFPAVTRTFKTLAWRYDVTAEHEDGKVALRKRVLANDFHLPHTMAEKN